MARYQRTRKYPAARSSPLAAGLSSGLVGYWRLTELSGSRADSSGNGNTLTDNNTVGNRAGKVGANAALFASASSESLSRADQASFEPGTGSWTMCGWVELDSTATTQTIIGKAQTTTQLGFRITHDGSRFEARMGSTTEEVLAETAASYTSTITWWFVAAWFDSVAQTINVQVDNGTIYSGSVVSPPFTLADGAYSFRLGGRDGGTPQYFSGGMEQWGLWIGRVLTADERSYIYNSGAGRQLY